MALSNKFLKRAGLGELVAKKKKRRMPQIRTMATLLNKQKKMKALYGRLYRKSEKAKAREAKDPKKNPNKTYFCDKFPTFDSYAKNYKMREIKHADKKVSKSTVTPKRSKVWGM